MCLGKAYVERSEGNQELVMESVSLLEVRGDKLRLSTIFGEEKELPAAIRTIDFENSRIILKAV